MSNNLVSQQLSLLNKQVGQMEPISNNLDPSISNMQIGTIGPISNYAASQKLVISDNQMVLVDPMSDSPGSHSLPALSRHIEQMEPKRSDLGSQQFILPNQHVGEMEAMFNNMGSQKLLSNKRREPMSNNFVPQPMSNNFMPQPMSNNFMPQPMSNNFVPQLPQPMSNNFVLQQLPVINKPMAHMEILSGAPGLQPPSVPHKKTIQMQPMSGTSGLQNSPAPNKRMVRNDSISSRSGSQHSHTPKNRTVQMEHSPKVHTESFESVRSKMRDSLASALALVSQNQNKAPNEEKKSQSEAAVSPRQMQEVSQPVESTSTSADASDYVSENPMDTLPSKESCSADKLNDGQSTSQTIEGMDHSVQTLNCNGQALQSDTFLLHRDVSLGDNFFVKDELLQGNGLTWAMDLDMELAETKEVQVAKKPKLVHENVGAARGEQAVQSPQNLAFKIEAELFKLFGGVNKKYKEKGRSLLFNLKDRSNPELRERVISGEISPERLCSMTAEELASKELSEWRMAKAEELAQMVVLPDSDIDIRRLVKKTHKGEFQVEVDQDDGVSVEVSVGTSSLSHNRPKKKETGSQPPAKSNGNNDRENVVDDKSSSEKQDPSCSLTIPSDGADLMQGLIVEELKDVDFLPPIVSLDEFMESLDSEPPFENLPVDAGKTVPHSEKESLEAGRELVASDPSKDPEETTSGKVDKEGKADKMDVKYTELDVKVKSSENLTEQKKSPPGGASKGEHVWEGVLQISISAMVTVVGCFRSGEKTSTKEWPSSLEIKGRVRLDAFEKFLQELPMSRSRAVMVVEFVLKEGSSENEHASLSEVVDSYVMDERLGFAEPAPGVELYFCPPHTKILEMLSKNLPKDHTEVLKSMDNGLIGVVVWRKVHLTSTVSPNSSSYHKRSSKKQHFSSRRPQDKETNMNVNYASEPPLHLGATSFNSQPPPDVDDDDIPPGFGPGPGPARDEDDLPEFNFSGGPNLSLPKFSSQNPSHGSGMTPLQAPSRPVDHVRELIHKYGQTGSAVASPNWQDKKGVGVGINPWNDDEEDDDIPEWQPQAPQQQPTPQASRHGFQQQLRLPHAVNQQHLGLAAMPQQPMVQLAAPVAMPSPSLHPQANVMQGAWLARPSGHNVLRPSMPSLLESQPGGGQYYGAPVHRAGQPSAEWRHEASRSRGF
ncbi:uncharacterized protein LOC132304408 [Cornus florida]|uniref:uncharacterized protein LOC132304408 n=1 Tax=Cornus florida TaxID=4283 RepID=UPI0028993926|nr:uncharacterized protein LOC132304408 [Cornus florida]